MDQALDPGFQLSAFTTDQILNNNDSCYSNPEYDRLFAEQATTIDRADRLAVVHQMQQILYNDSPYVVLYYAANLQAYRADRWTGWQLAPVGAPASVLGLLPAGYPPGACSPDPEVPLGALAALSCSANTDPGGPVHGHYTVVADRKNLQEQFDRLVQTSRQQVCPGRIQSPGPWRHNATPDQVAGTLYCGVRPDNSPFIAWTDDAKMLLAVVDSTPGDEATTFKWWSAHS